MDRISIQSHGGKLFSETNPSKISTGVDEINVVREDYDVECVMLEPLISKPNVILFIKSSFHIILFCIKIFKNRLTKVINVKCHLTSIILNYIVYWLYYRR